MHYFLKLIFVGKSYDVVFVTSAFFNRGESAEDILLKPMIESYGGDYLIRGGEIEALETKLWTPTRIVLVKFPNKKAAMDWYNSEEYKPYKKIRFNTSTSNILMVEGIK